MIILLLILTLCFSPIYAQDENQSQSIELPDFVITGKESISIPKIQKSMSDFIPLLSNKFFTPDFPNEEKTTVELPELNTEIINIGKNSQLTKALLRFNAGLETWPLGEFYYNDWTDNFIYNINLFGKNELEFVKKGGLSLAGASLGSKYFVDHSSNFLPGLEISLNGSYHYESFNFYGHTNPGLDRITDNGDINLSLNYASDANNSFGLSITDSYYKQRDFEIDENVIGTEAYYKFKYDNFDLKLDGSYRNQSTSNLIGSNSNQYYFNTRASVGLLLYDILNIKTGIYLAEKEGNTFFSPTVFGSLKFDDNFSFFGEFAPYSEFVTLKDFSHVNRYFINNGFANTIVENKANIKLALKYEYESYFEFSGGIGYLNSDNNFYFEDKLNPGFLVVHIEDTENKYAFINFLFRKGPFGQFYGDVKFQEMTAENGNYLPYNSKILGEFSYMYDWNSEFGVKLTLSYFSESYADIENTAKIPEGLDLGASFNYEIFSNFDLTVAFENLLNNKYYYFRNYRAKPFDVLVGFEFRW